MEARLSPKEKKEKNQRVAEKGKAVAPVWVKWSQRHGMPEEPGDRVKSYGE